MSLSRRRVGLLLLLLGPVLPGAVNGSERPVHTELRATTPADSARLMEVPGEIRLRFSGDVELGFTELELVGPDGETVALGEPRHQEDSANVVVARVPGLPEAGTYTVRWRTAALDGHPLQGSFHFVVEPGAAGLPAEAPDRPDRGDGEPDAAVEGAGEAETPGAPDADAGVSGSGFDAQSPLYAAVRWLTFVGLLGLIGAVAFRVIVLGLMTRMATGHGDHTVERPGDFAAETAVRAARLGLTAAAVLLVATVLRLYAQSYAFHGPGDALAPSGLRTILTETGWGRGWLLQVGAVLLAGAGLAMHRWRPSLAWSVAAVGAVVLAFTPALSGHAAAVPERTWVAVAADGLHVLGAGGWIGTLFVTVVAGLPAALGRGRTVGDAGEVAAALIRAFSPTALAFAGVVVVSGVVSAWFHLGSVSDLWGSAYGRTLLLKLAVLTVVFGTGAYNWLRVKPNLGEEKAAGHLRRSAAVELAAGVAVLVVTAVLVATPPPAEAPEEPVAESVAGAATVAEGEGGAAETDAD